VKKLIPLALALGVAASAPAIVIRHDRPVANYNAIGSDPLFNSSGFFAGVGSSSAFGSGVMVSPTKIVTAAHLFDDNNDGVLDFSPSAIGFGVGNNTTTVGANIASIAINPQWASTNGRPFADWAVVTLSTAINGLNYASVSNADPRGLMGAMVGYGAQGLGTTGWGNSNIPGANDRLGAYNMIDTIGTSGFLNGSILTDFDNPNSAASSSIGSSTPLDLEGTTAPGDSGSGLFGNFGGNWFLVGTLNGGSTNNSVYSDVSYYSALFSQTQNQNFLISNGVSVVPEPMTMTVLALAGLALARRRRKA
jgi:MYXO-CTERM domain-containing protein